MIRLAREVEGVDRYIMIRQAREVEGGGPYRRECMWCGVGGNKRRISPHNKTRGFNGSVNISESCDFQSQFNPLYIIF